MSSLRDWLDKASVANVVSAFCVIGGLIYGCYTRNGELVSFIVGAAVGYLLKRKAEE